jgi:V/A-type H+-transporting ATPase subunit I
LAVVKLKEVSIIGKLADIDGVATVCGRSGVFHADDAMMQYGDTPDFTAFSEENPYTEPLQTLRDALTKAGKEVTLLSEKESKNIHMSAEEAIAYAKDITAKLKEWEASKAQAQAKLAEYEESMEAMGHFVGLNLDLDEISACEYVNVRFGSLPKENLEKLNAYKENPNVIFTPCTADETRQWGLYFAPAANASDVDRIFSGLKFQKVTLETMTGKPEDTVAALRQQRDAEAQIISQAEASTEALWNSEKAKIQQVYTVLAEKNVYYSAICRSAARYEDNFVIIGWIPKEAEADLKKELSQFKLIELSFKGGKEVAKHNPPVKLKNLPFFRGYEFYTKMYGMPGPEDIDPTPFIAIMYTILFGIMFGDVGQGFFIALIGFCFMWLKLKMQVGRILLHCGISSMIFGFFYGSVFGFEEWLNPVHQAMGIAFNHHAGKFIEVMSADTSPYIIYFTMGLGVVMIVITLIMNIILKFKNGHIGQAIFSTNGIAGMAFYIGLAGVLANLIVGDLCDYMGFNFFSLPWLLGMVLAPLVFIFFQEPMSELFEGHGFHLEGGVGNFIMQNIFEIIVLAIETMSTIMSFLRVGAFVLVHAGMMQVVFSLAQVFGGDGGVVYIIIIVIGNGVITALEALLVCIQVLRLNYYEMFNRFYAGNGREYVPVVASEMLEAK